jgi:hypothetical protein
MGSRRIGCASDARTLCLAPKSPWADYEIRIGYQKISKQEEMAHREEVLVAEAHVCV